MHSTSLLTIENIPHEYQSKMISIRNSFESFCSIYHSTPQIIQHFKFILKTCLPNTKNSKPRDLQVPQNFD